MEDPSFVAEALTGEEKQTHSMSVRVWIPALSLNLLIYKMETMMIKCLINLL